MIENLTRQNIRLSGEVAILRQNIVSIEKENYKLKETQQASNISTFSESEKIKKELKILQTENRIKENQLRVFKRPKTNTQIDNLDYEWILKNVSKEIKFSLYPFEYERLKILNSYFYNEFEKLLFDHETIINEFLRLMNEDLKILYKFFMLFCGKKEFFDHFFPRLLFEFNERGNIKTSKFFYKILIYCDLSYIVAFVEENNFFDGLNVFLNENLHCEWCLLFYKRIALERPFLLNIFLSKCRFQKILEYNHLKIKFLLDAMPCETLKKYIDHNNLNFIDQKTLALIFKEEFF